MSEVVFVRRKIADLRAPTGPNDVAADARPAAFPHKNAAVVLLRSSKGMFSHLARRAVVVTGIILSVEPINAGRKVHRRNRELLVHVNDSRHSRTFARRKWSKVTL